MFRFTDPDNQEFMSGRVKRNTFHEIPSQSNDPIGTVPVLNSDNQIKFGSLGDCDSITSALLKTHMVFQGNWGDTIGRIDSVTGAKVWEANLGNFVMDIAVDSDGNVYACAGNYLYKYDKGGNQVWSYNRGGDTDAVAVSRDGTFIALYSGYYTNIQALDQDRNVLWTSGGGSWNLRIDENKNVFSDNGSKYDKDGNQLWNFDSRSTIYDLALDKNGNVYYAEDNGYVEQVLADGTPGWSIETGNSRAWSIGINPEGDSFLYVGLYTGLVRKLSISDGSQLWEYNLQQIGSYDPNGVAVDTQENVYVGGYYSVEALDKDKNLLWTWNNAPGEIHSVEIDP